MTARKPLTRYSAPDGRARSRLALPSYTTTGDTTSEDAREFITSIFQNGGRTLDFQIGEPQIRFSERGDAAIVCYPWRERFRHSDGHQTDTEYYETDVWFLRNDEWRIAHIHQSVVREHPIPG